MGNKTLHLPKKAVDPLDEIAMTPGPIQAAPISDDAIAEYLRSKGFVIVKDIPDGPPRDKTENIPTAPPAPVDLSKLPPAGERSSEPVQAPKGKWGNPRFFSQAPPNAAPQPPGVPHKGR